MDDVKKSLCVITLILTTLNTILFLIYLISPYSELSFYLIALFSAVPVFSALGKGIYVYNKKKTYPLTWVIIYCINANIFLIASFIYHILT